MSRPDVDDEFSSFVAAHGPALLRYAYLLTGSRTDAEELVQDTLERVYLAWHRIAQVGSPLAYTRTALARTHISRWRRHSHRLATETRTAFDRSVSRERAFESAPEERDAMWRLLATLPPRQRVVLVLRFYEDLTEKDIGEALGISVGTVKSQLSRGLATLRARHALAESGAVRASQEVTR
jgi:RNA polymerase sigma-70 factor (sigma-E family)